MKIVREIKCQISEDNFKKSAQTIFESYKKQYAFAKPTLAWNGSTATVKFSVLFIKVEASIDWYDKGLKIQVEIPKGAEKYEKSVMDIVLSTVKQYDPSAAFI
jgi:hypothetical protein